MIPVCRAETVRALDAAVIEGLGIPARVLMELAGRGAADAIHTRWPDCPIGVLCGAGNNGGDGYVIARWLHLWGHPVWLYAAAPPRTPDAIVNADLCASMGIPTRTTPAGPGVLVDALLGTGQSRPPRGAYAHAVDACVAADAAGLPVVAIDLPTGVHADTGVLLGGPRSAVRATLTVALGRLKPGLLCHPGAAHAGELHIVDIGLDLAHIDRPPAPPPDAWLLEARDVAAWAPATSPCQAKWDRGHVAIRAGGGAAILAAHGALRGGAGLVTILTEERNWPRLHGVWPEVMLAPPDALDPTRHDALVIGPGLGLDAAAEVLQVWRDFPRPAVFDADAITVLARSPAPLPSPHPRVLTPHSAEAGRLLGQTKAAVDADRFASVKALSRWGTALLKGPNTLIASAPTAPVWVNPRGAPALATAGSGDVLSGVIGAGLAAGQPPPRAAALGAWLHGSAGETLRAGATASDIVAALTPSPTAAR